MSFFMWYCLERMNFPLSTTHQSFTNTILRHMHRNVYIFHSYLENMHWDFKRENVFFSNAKYPWQASLINQSFLLSLAVEFHFFPKFQLNPVGRHQWSIKILKKDTFLSSWPLDRSVGMNCIANLFNVVLNCR